MDILEPYRESHTYEQELCRPTEDVFPLLCPVRETEWVDGWDPSLVLTESGIAEDEAVFVVEDAIWTITDYRPPEPDETGRDVAYIAFVKTVPERTVTHIRILVWDDSEETSRARISYSMTALTEDGEEDVDAFTEEDFGRFMITWEDAMNAFLGRMRR